MAQSILIFDFGTDEKAAQQARHKIEGWKQAFRLGDKLLLKFDRRETEAQAKQGDEEGNGAAPKPSRKGKAIGRKASEKDGKADRVEKPQPAGRVRVLIRLAFSDHEKLSHQRWLDRIPVEEPFKSARSETIRSGASEFAKASEEFDALD